MRERVCKNCGGRSYSVVGQNMVKCKFCGTLYVDEQSSKEEEVLIVQAYEKAREGRFSQAVEEFDKIIALYPMSFEAYFGKVLAKNRIVLYNKRSGSKKPRFFGDEIPSILEDKDFKRAIELSPPETAKTYTMYAKRIEKLNSLYQETKKNSFDVVMCAMKFDKDDSDSIIAKTIAELEKQNVNIYFLQGLQQKEKEEETFVALNTCKAFVFFANDTKGYIDEEYRNLYDRYFYFVARKKKTKSAFIIALDKQKVKLENLPKELASCKSILDINSSTFLQDIQIKLKKEFKNTIDEVAKIETVKIEKVDPQRKEYVDVENINPTELGHYHVENVELSETNKIKWIFLTLKNGDFATANELIEEELKKDKYNAELLFAQLMAKRNIKTQEEFFANIANFQDKEAIDLILRYASKDFAEEFVDKWENLIININSEEYYNAFLIYLAQYNSPNRDNFVSKAEHKAVETLDEELIEKVLKCFRKDEVERFVNFYFTIAQKSDDQEYYEKVLEIDEGHEQSNLAMLLQNFKTDEDKLTYRNKEEVEAVLKYLGEDTRAQFVSAVTNMILPIAFYDIGKAEKQLDFYLSYISKTSSLVAILKNIALKFQEVGFFKQAEKYISIALSKEKNQGELYWLLMQIKMHCKTDSEMIVSNIKITQFPEWQSLLSVCNEQQVEHYAEIVSKANLYTGEKSALKPETIDKKNLLEKLQSFVDRNNKIMIEMQKQEGEAVLRGIEYYKLQLQPFENYIQKITNCKKMQDYLDILLKINARLDALDLTLDSSLNVLTLLNKEEGLKNVLQPNKKVVEKRTKENPNTAKSKFLKRFLYGFLELFPLLFTTLLLGITLALPKEVYRYFSQDFLIVMTIISIAVGLINLVVFIKLKSKFSRGWNVATMAIFCIGIVNLVLMIFSFYLTPKAIEINSAKEFEVFTQNANYCELVLKDDIDLEGKKWKSVNFQGTLDGNGHSVKNIKFYSKGSAGLFKTNGGTIENLTLYLAENSYQGISNFGAFASKNNGQIKNCSVFGSISFVLGDNANIGGLVGQMQGGIIENCETNLTITISIDDISANIGGLVGEIREGNNETILKNNKTNNALTITSSNSQTVNVGGMIGLLNRIEGEEIDFSQNVSGANIVVSGKTEKIVVGGLVGQGSSASKNNISNGFIKTTAVEGVGYAGGLYGVYQNTVWAERISTSYSTIEIETSTNVEAGGLVGGLGGIMENCFSTVDADLLGNGNKPLFTQAQPINCLKLTATFYDNSLNFDPEVWNLSSIAYPTLK